MVNRYHAVRNVRAVALEFQLPLTNVSRVLAEHNIDASRRKTEAQIDNTVELDKQGSRAQRLAGAGIRPLLNLEGATRARSFYRTACKSKARWGPLKGHTNLRQSRSPSLPLRWFDGSRLIRLSRE